MKTCAKCGRKIEKYHLDYVVNPGKDNEFITCEHCHDSMVDNDEIIQCESCGEWFTPDSIHEEEIYDNTFSPCPRCGYDMIEGTSREEFIKEHAPYKYSMIVTSTNGNRRGYTVSAYGIRDAFVKLIDELTERKGVCGSEADYLASINCAEMIWPDKDNIA